MDNSNNFPSKDPMLSSKKPGNTWLFVVIAIIITTLVVGVGMYFWQQSKVKTIIYNSVQQANQLQNQYNDLYNKFTDLLEDKNLPLPEDVVLPKEDKFCIPKNIKQGIYGRVGTEGMDCGIIPGSCFVSEAVATLYITSPLDKYDKNLLIKKIKTDERGCFEAELKVGNYSIFVFDSSSLAQDSCENEKVRLQEGFETCDDGGRYMCELWSFDAEKQIRTCSPFSISKDEILEKNSIHSGSGRFK